MYVRRLYRSYDVLSVETSSGVSDSIVSSLKFKFKDNEDSSVLVKSGSSNNLSAMFQAAGAMSPDRDGHGSNEHRTGVIAVFDKYEDLENGFIGLVNSIKGKEGDLRASYSRAG